MKKKSIERTAPIPTRKKGYWVTAQVVGDILVLNMFHEKKLYARHCLDLRTREYATLEGTAWNAKKIEGALGCRPEEYANYYYTTSETDRRLAERFRLSKEDEALINERIAPLTEDWWVGDGTVDKLRRIELERGRELRETLEINRKARVRDIMDSVPEPPDGMREWLDGILTGGMDYMTRNHDVATYTCSACGAVSRLADIRCEDGTKKPRHKDMVFCPACGARAQIIKRSNGVVVSTHFMVIQPMDEKQSVTRHFRGMVQCGEGMHKRVFIEERVRLTLPKHPKGKECVIYYRNHYMEFDNKSNPQNERIYDGYLYDGGIEEALRGTAYEPWSRLFAQLAAAGQKLDYNRMMVAYRNDAYIRLMEMLFKGRFYKLLQEQSGEIYFWDAGYHGGMNLHGNTIEEVFGIEDRQKINRIRDKDGGEDMVAWMQWSDECGQKVSDKALGWIAKNGLGVEDMDFMDYGMSVEQAMNYIERQKKESYPKLTPKQVCAQYRDYLGMCERLGKDMEDAIVYRPRELKRRHDEAVLQIELQEAQLKADEYSRKYPEAEKVLGEIKGKFEYRGKEFFIIVPDKIVDVVAEGRHLHHCAGATDRYFDRIKSHETYICFCRRVSEPDTPFYTIEVEPGGAIRQHRGMFDEEPEIEKVKPFLREWQQEIKKRMSREDRQRAEASRVKREENIAELKERNNTRVLNGLMEDFMEAM